MKLYEFIDKVISFGKNNPLIALIGAVVFLFLIYRRPKLILSIIILILILAGIYYVIMDTVSSVRTEKHSLIHESEKSSRITDSEILSANAVLS